MEKKLVLKLNNHNVYYIKTDSINYYLTVPKNYNKTNICIELKSKMHNYNLDMNDEIWVMENVKNTFNFIDEYNITLVLPILSEEDTNILEKMDAEKFERIDKLIGLTINGAYTNLKEENVDIEPEVIMINNDRYKTFINWFISKYNNRVVCKNLLDLIRRFNANATVYKKMETPGMTYVVGSYNTEVNAPKVVKEEEEPEINLVPQHSSGFTSYWLLIAITIVIVAIVAIIVFLMK